jgi:hypothetical protein
MEQATKLRTLAKWYRDFAAGFVELDLIGPGRLQIADFGVDRGDVVHDQLFLVLVELVLG